MGRTVPTVRQSMEALSAKLQKMAHIMNSGDVELLNSVLIKGRRHAHEVSYSDIEVGYGFLISIIIELEREIRELKAENSHE
ncbi:MAG: hypothetical protein M1129_02910 [Candidatus Thermoplasmatota archaeon]|jgi:hypothetical protein|nr:hypothetical protein [Candidatus Thermoplasmatota archaeon]